MTDNPMLKFVNIPRLMPQKRDALDRTDDFGEIYAEFSESKAAEQASRCSQCGVPYCQTHCPLHNNIPDWLRLTAEGRLREAYEISQATNTFPEICGRICPQDRLCEGNCVIEQSGHETVTIGSVEKYITDTAWAEGWVQPITPAATRGESVGIIGAGPGGLAAADMLRRAGVQVTVYDRYDRAGGLLTYGIPGFKLEKDVVMQRVAQLEEGGVEIVTNCNVGVDISFEEIRIKHDAVIIAKWKRPSPETIPCFAKAAGLYMICTMSKHAAEAKGCSDAMMLDYRGYVAEATGANLFFVKDGDVHTPKPDCFLNGITRQTVVSMLQERGIKVIERHIMPEELEGFEQCWLTGTAAEVTPVGYIGDYTFEVGALARDIAESYEKLVRT